MASVIQWTASCAAILVSAVWVASLLAILRRRNGMHWLADLPDELPSGEWPALAVIFAARNEGNVIEQATRSILAQDYPALAVIAADDRSDDATGTILDRLA